MLLEKEKQKGKYATNIKDIKVWPYFIAENMFLKALGVFSSQSDFMWIT